MSPRLNKKQIMKNFKTFTSFSVDDLEKAKEFYAGTLGLEVTVNEKYPVLMSRTGGDTRFMAYLKDDHKPAEHTVLNFDVEEIEPVIENLRKEGVVFEKVNGTNENGIAEMEHTKAAWFRDPAGNWIGIFQGTF